MLIIGNKKVLERRDIIKKFLLPLITFLLFFFGLQRVNADKYTLVKDNYQNIYYVQNGLPEHYGSDIQFKFTLNGKIAFCLDPKLSIKHYEYFGIPLTDTTYDLDTQDYLNKVIYYGYDYPNHQNERYYMATQALIWEKVSNYLIEFYTERYGYGTYIDVSNEKTEILNLINNHNKLPYFSNNEYSYNLTNYIEFEDEVLNNFEIASTTWNDAYIENNKLIIKNLDNYVGNIRISLKKKSYRNDIATYYFEDGTQPLITGGKPNDVYSNLSINIKGAKIRINKLDKDSNLPIKNKNIEFNIINLDTGNYIYINGEKNLKINDEGYLITDMIPFGRYKITEVKSSDDYYLNENSVEILVNDDTISNNTYEFNFYNELKKGSITIQKKGQVYDERNNTYSFKNLENIEYKLYANEDIVTSDGTIHYKKGDIVAIKKTNNIGFVEFNNLVLGNYCFIETETLPIYNIDNESHCFNLRELKGVYYQHRNYLKTSNIKILKYDADSKKTLPNVQFGLYAKEDFNNGIVYYKKDQLISKQTTNSEGIIEFNSLIYGKYYVKELSSLGGYKKNEKKYEINLSADEYYLEIENSLERGSIKFEKSGEVFNYKTGTSNFKKLENIEYRLYASDDIVTGDGTIYYKKGDIVSIKSTNSSGIVIFDELVLGNYCITENKTLPEYIIDNNSYCFNLYDSKNIYYEHKNYLKKGSLKITKLDLDSKLPIKNNNIVFNIKNLDTNRYIYINNTKDLKLNSEGYLYIENIPFGEYLISEMKTLPIYELNKNDKKIFINEDTIDKSLNYVNEYFYNEKKLGSINILKQDYNTKKFITNVEFTLYAMEDIITPDNVKHYSKGDVVSKKLTDEYGLISFNNLILGKYYIKETKTNNDYIIDVNEYSFDLTKNDKNNIVIKNKLKRKSISLKKYGEVFNYKTLIYNFEPLSNIEFMLYAKEDIISSDSTLHYKKGDTVSTKKTDDLGQIKFDDLILGKYCLIEKKTKNNYILDENEYCFDLYEDENTNITLYNYLKKSDLIIKKIDASTGDILKNVYFEIFNNDESLGIYETDEFGIIKLENLPLTKYKIKEIKTNDDYILDTKVKIIDLNKQNEIIIKNNKKVKLPNTLNNDYSSLILILIFSIGSILANVKKIG